MRFPNCLFSACQLKAAGVNGARKFDLRSIVAIMPLELARLNHCFHTESYPYRRLWLHFFFAGINTSLSSLVSGGLKANSRELDKQ